MKPSRLYLLACYAFFSIGISASLMGPALSTLATRSGITLDEAGYLFTTMSMGFLLSAPLINWVRQHISVRVLLIGSPWLVIISMALLALGRTFPVQAIGAFVLGLGQSGTQYGYNIMFGTGPNASGVLNRLHSFFGVGALIGPLLAALGYTLTGEATLAFAGAAILSVPLSIGMVLWRGGGANSTAVPHRETTTTGLSQSPWRSAGFWLMILVIGLYVGGEVAFTGWVTEFTLRRTGVSIAQAALSTSTFFVGLAFSRYMLERITRRITPLAYVAVLLLVSVVTLGLMLVANTLPLMLLGAFVMGFGCGPIFPTLIATGIQRFPHHATLVSSTLVSTGSAGGVVLPALTGILITRNPSGAWLLLAGVFVLIGLGWQVIRSETRRLPREAEVIRP